MVLAVDRDGDLERKTRIRSPVFGREALMAAATTLAVADPEEADANALFAAVREYVQPLPNWIVSEPKLPLAWSIADTSEAASPAVPEHAAGIVAAEAVSQHRRTAAAAVHKAHRHQRLLVVFIPTQPPTVRASSGSRHAWLNDLRSAAPGPG